MKSSLDIAISLVMVGIVPAIFFFNLITLLVQHLLRLQRFIAAKVNEYQGLDRGEILTLLIDAGLSYEQALWFYETFYTESTGWERCLIKLFIKKHCF